MLLMEEIDRNSRETTTRDAEKHIYIYIYTHINHSDLTADLVKQQWYSLCFFCFFGVSFVWTI